MKKAKKSVKKKPAGAAVEKRRAGAPYTRDVLPGGGPLVGDEGRFNMGTFDQAFTVVNPQDAERPFALPLPGFLKRSRLKEWEAFQLGDDRFFMLVVIYNARSFGLVQFICHDRARNEKLLYEKIVPCTATHVARGLHESKTWYRSRSFSISVTNRLNAGLIGIDIAIRDYRKLPPVQASFLAFHKKERVSPIVVCQPLGANRAMYSHKCLMPMEGELALGNERYEFDDRSSFAIMDDHKGYYPYNLRYDWVTGAGFVRGGGHAGFNLTRNQVLDPERYNENCLWIGGEMHVLPPVEFSRPDGPEGEWFIKDRFGMVNMSFTPDVPGTIMMNLGLLKVDYYGPFGPFKGFVMDSKGKKVTVDGFFGMGEQKHLRA